MTLQALGGVGIHLAVGTTSEGSPPLLEVRHTHTHTHTHTRLKSGFNLWSSWLT
jgi:hypothetical protein